MRDFDEHNLTDEVVRRWADTPDPRTRTILQALTRHVHAFVKEVELTEAEWWAAIQFLTRTGQICDDRRQEFVLLSDIFGVSMLVDAINHGRQAGATESTVLGPFYVDNAPSFPLGADISGAVEGTPLYVEGVVRSADGAPLTGATVDVWQSDDDGHYDLQLPGLDGFHLRGRLTTDADGRFYFWSIMPRFYPIPNDGPVGQLLELSHRHPFRPAHVHFMIAAPGHERLCTHVFVEGDAYLESDAVFGVKSSLIGRFERHPGPGPDGRAVGEHVRLRYDFGLKPAAATLDRAA